MNSLPADGAQADGTERRPPTAWRHSRPPRWLPRAAATVAVVWIAVGVAWGTLSQLHDLAVILVSSLFIAFAIEPGVNRLARRGWRRGAATGVIYGLLLLALLVVVASVGALVVDQVASLAKTLPDLINSLSDFLQQHFKVNLNQQLSKLESNLGTIGTSVAGNALSISGTIVGSIFNLLTVALFTFYFAAQGPDFRRSVCSLMPPQRQRVFLQVWELAIEKTAGYLYSRAILAAISAVAHGIAFFALGIPYAFTLGIFVGIVGQFIPTVGTYIGAALPALVALPISPLRSLAVIVFAILYQQVENYVLTPPLSAKTMELHPAVAFGAVLVGVTLVGPVGALLALPVTATVQAFVSSYIQRHEVVESHAFDEQMAERRRAKKSGSDTDLDDTDLDDTDLDDTDLDDTDDEDLESADGGDDDL